MLKDFHKQWPSEYLNAICFAKDHERLKTKIIEVNNKQFLAQVTINTGKELKRYQTEKAEKNEYLARENASLICIDQL